MLIRWSLFHLHNSSIPFIHSFVRVSAYEYIHILNLLAAALLYILNHAPHHILTKSHSMFARVYVVLGICFVIRLHWREREKQNDLKNSMHTYQAILYTHIIHTCNLKVSGNVSQRNVCKRSDTRVLVGITGK